MVDRKGLHCELCRKPARVFCPADDASLCWTCDASVHSANFLVARHHRSLLCRSCATPAEHTRNYGRRIHPTPPPFFCSNCSSMRTERCISYDLLTPPASPPPPPPPSSSSSSASASASTLSFVSASSSCNGSTTVDSCNGGGRRKPALSLSHQKYRENGRTAEEQEKEITLAMKENLGVSDACATSFSSTTHDDIKLSRKGSCGHRNLNTTAAPSKDEQPRQKHCKLSLSVSRQNYCKNGGGGSDEEEEEEKEAMANNENGDSDALSASSPSTPCVKLRSKGTSSATPKQQPRPSSAHVLRADGKSADRRGVGAARSKRARC